MNFIILEKSRVKAHPSKTKTGKLVMVREFERRGDKKLQEKEGIARALYRAYVHNQPGDLIKLIKPKKFSGQLYRGIEEDIGSKHVDYHKDSYKPYFKKPLKIKTKKWTNWSTTSRLSGEFSGAVMISIPYSGKAISLDEVYELVKDVLPELSRKVKNEDDDNWVRELKEYRRGESKTFLVPPIEFNLKNIKSRSEYDLYS